MLAARALELEFRGSAACRVCSPLAGTPGANCGSGSCTQWARWTVSSWPNPARWSVRRQGDELRQRASRGQNAAKDVLGVRKLLT